MKYRVIDSTLHGLLDYAAAAALIVLPFVLGLGDREPLAPLLSVGAGAALIVYSLLTDYRFGVARLLSYRAHLLADRLAAAAFVLTPFVFGFDGLVAGYFAVMGIGVVVVVALSCGTRASQAQVRLGEGGAHE